MLFVLLLLGSLCGFEYERQTEQLLDSFPGSRRHELNIDESNWAGISCSFERLETR